jgi:hypothetical protein
MDGGSSSSGSSSNSSESDGVRIAKMDKIMEDLLAELDDKKKQMLEDYIMLKQNVEENPYLKNALGVYENYFSTQQKQIDALEILLKVVPLIDQPEIKREIKRLKKYLID